MKNGITAVCMRMRLRADASIAKLIGVVSSFIKKMLMTNPDEESPTPDHSEDVTLSLNEEQLETLQAAVEICPDATLEELQRLVADQCRVTVSQMSIFRALQQLNLPPAKREGKIDQFHSSGHQEIGNSGIALQIRKELQ
jgi:transposase